MNQSVDSPLSGFGSPLKRVENALQALREGKGVLVVDDENRENEGDLIYSAETLTEQQMAMLIRECSGIVCVCLTDDRVRELGLPMMVRENQSPYQTAFTVSVEATRGVTTGVSAADRLRTVLACTTEEADPLAVRSPGHVFPLRACSGGVLERRGHTEATVDLMKLAGLRPFGVLCEVTNPDGTMARLPEIVEMGKRHDMPVLTVEDIVQYRLSAENSAQACDSENTKRTAA